MTGVDELVAFVRARLDEQESAIIAYREHRASKGQCVNFEGVDPAEVPFNPDSGACVIHIRLGNALDYGNVAYGLAEIEAKRRILERCETVRDEVRNPATGEHYANARARQFQLEEVLQLLAQPYAGREGWREEWRSEPA